MFLVPDVLFYTVPSADRENRNTGRRPVVAGPIEWWRVASSCRTRPATADVMQRAAYYVDRILKGAKPVRPAVEQPTKFDLVINLKTPRPSA